MHGDSITAYVGPEGILLKAPCPRGGLGGASLMLPQRNTEVMRTEVCERETVRLSSLNSLSDLWQSSAD